MLPKVKNLVDLSTLDIRQSLVLWRLWLYRAWVNHRLYYQKSRLGLFWPFLSVAMFTLVLGAIWGSILAKEDVAYYLAYLAIGFPVWQMISGVVEKSNIGFNEGSSASGLPLSIQVFERVSSSFIGFINVLPVLLFAILVSKWSEITLIGFAVSLFFLLVYCFGVSLIISVITTTYPDIKHLIMALMRLAFLATPIIWEARRLGDYEKYLVINPFYLPLGFVRSSIHSSEQFSYFIIFSPAYSLAVFMLGCLVFTRYFNIARQKL